MKEASNRKVGRKATGRRVMNKEEMHSRALIIQIRDNNAHHKAGSLGNSGHHKTGDHKVDSNGLPKTGKDCQGSNERANQRVTGRVSKTGSHKITVVTNQPGPNRGPEIMKKKK